MITNMIAEQVAVIKKASSKATKSRKSALQFMEEAGIGRIQPAPSKHLKEGGKTKRRGR